MKEFTKPAQALDTENDDIITTEEDHTFTEVDDLEHFFFWKKPSELIKC